MLNERYEEHYQKDKYSTLRFFIFTVISSSKKYRSTRTAAQRHVQFTLEVPLNELTVFSTLYFLPKTFAS